MPAPADIPRRPALLVKGNWGEDLEERGELRGELGRVEGGKIIYIWDYNLIYCIRKGSSFNKILKMKKIDEKRRDNWIKCLSLRLGKRVIKYIIGAVSKLWKWSFNKAIELCQFWIS